MTIHEAFRIKEKHFKNQMASLSFDSALIGEICRIDPSPKTIQGTDQHLSRYRKLIEDCNIGDTREIWDTHLTSTNKAIFFCNTIIRTIDACLQKEYTSFDAHTTSNCCHGISLLVRDLIFTVLKFNLNELTRKSFQKIQELETGLISEFKSFTDWVPQPLIVLASLYVLAFIRDIDVHKRMRTEARKLKTISQVGVSFCWEIANALQAHFSNLVANSYRLYLEDLHPMMDINGAPVCMWGSYLEKNHIRVDRRGVQYASCVYSTQISLAHLISTRSKVALVNDIISSSGEFLDRFTCIFQGDGHSSLKLIPQEELAQMATSDKTEPVVVFGGYVRSDTLNASSLAEHMEEWLDRFPNLMLACEVFYPQFPNVTNDPDFNNAPIIPSEERLRKLFLSHSNVQGVSAFDPSLYCSSHTYTASLEEVLAAYNEKNASLLPNCFHSLQIPASQMWGVEMHEPLPSRKP